LWPYQYYVCVCHYVFDIDFSNNLYISDKMIINDMLKGVPLLILANKQDLEVSTVKPV